MAHLLKTDVRITLITQQDLAGNLGAAEWHSESRQPLVYACVELNEAPAAFCLMSTTRDVGAVAGYGSVRLHTHAAMSFLHGRAVATSSRKHREFASCPGIFFVEGWTELGTGSPIAQQ